MEYVGDGDGPAPPLGKARLEPGEARRLFDVLLRDIELWLAHDRIHADLSPYNILFHEGRLTVIDFPQAVDPRVNPDAQALLERDLENVCRYWNRHGVRADAARITRHMWGRWRRGELDGGPG
jgi:RIO kinase 1